MENESEYYFEGIIENAGDAEKYKVFVWKNFGEITPFDGEILSGVIE